MELYLMRHGIALSKEQHPDRPLSEDGAAQVYSSAAALRKLDVHLDAVVTSPKTRARQTAQIVADSLDLTADAIRETDQMKPDVDPHESIEYVNGLQECNAILVAGHMPSVARIASLLLTPHADGVAIRFVKAGICRIDVETLPTHQGILTWYLTAGQLALIAG